MIYVVCVCYLVSVSLFIMTVKNDFETLILTLALGYVSGKDGGTVLEIARTNNCQTQSIS